MIANPKILLIEDDRRLADNLRHVLEGEGFAVTHLARGDEGLARAINEEFTWCSPTCGCPAWAASNWCGSCTKPDRGCRSSS